MKNMSFMKTMLLTLLLLSGASKAAVVMNASRIIMAGSLEKTVTFDNTSENPFIVQVESVNKNEPEFIAMPPIFKIKEKGGQTVKIKLMATSMPQDKESLFYLNFTQIPGIKKNESGENRLNIIINSRLKIIYRPNSVNAFSGKNENDVFYHYQGGQLVISNNSPNVLSIRDISNDKKIIAEKLTIKPGEDFSKDSNEKNFKGPLHAVMINDFGTPVNFLISYKQT